LPAHDTVPHPYIQVGTFGLLAAAAMAGVRQWKEAELRVLKAQSGTFAEEVDLPLTSYTHDAAAYNSSTDVRGGTFHT